MFTYQSRVRYVPRGLRLIAACSRLLHRPASLLPNPMLAAVAPCCRYGFCLVQTAKRSEVSKQKLNQSKSVPNYIHCETVVFVARRGVCLFAAARSGICPAIKRFKKWPFGLRSFVPPIARGKFYLRLNLSPAIVTCPARHFLLTSLSSQLTP